MSNKSIFTLAILFTSVCFAHGVPHPHVRPASKFIHLLKTSIPIWLKEFQVPGAAVAVIEKGKLVYSSGFGVMEKKSMKPVTTSTIFPVASISKTLTAMGILRLADRGLINLDSSYFKYVKTWQLPTSKYDESKITIRQLLSHTAGISGRNDDYFLKKEDVPTIEQQLEKDKAGRSVTLIDTPGRKWRYSGNGYLMLQLLIQEVTGKVFETYMHDEVFVPLGMTHTSFVLNEQQVCSLYDQNLKQTPFEYFTAQSAAALNTTISDFSNFIINGLQPNNNFLSNKILSEAFRPALGTDSTYALGLFYERPINNTTIVGHDGGIPGVRSIFKYNPATGDAIVIFTNSSYGNSVFNNILCEWYPMINHIENRDICNPAANIANKILISLYTDGVNKARELFYQQKGNDKNFTLSEVYLSYWAYGLNNRGFGKDAILMLQLDVAVNPTDPNAYDSLAEICMRNGEKNDALTAYKKLLEIDPKNKNALENVSKLKNQ